MNNRYLSTLTESTSGIADIIADTPDLTVPGLGQWDLRGLVGHYLRALRTPLTYLDQPEPDSATLTSAVSYIVSYLDRRDADPKELDQAVAQRGANELADDADPAELIRTASGDLVTALAITAADRLVPTPFGGLQVAEYMRTRVLEITVHGLDIARATASDWQPPHQHLADCFELLAGVAIERGHAPELLLAMTGRIGPDRAPLPVLR